MKMKNKNIFGLVGVAILGVTANLALGTGVQADEMTHETYSLEDYVYFDPINPGADCNETNYWSIYNMETSCYRWSVLTSGDNAETATVEVLLDHNVGYDTYDNMAGILADTKAAWVNYSGEVNALSEDKYAELTQLSSRPTADARQATTAVPISRLMANSMFYKTGKSLIIMVFG